MKVKKFEVRRPLEFLPNGLPIYTGKFDLISRHRSVDKAFDSIPTGQGNLRVIAITDEGEYPVPYIERDQWK